MKFRVQVYFCYMPNIGHRFVFLLTLSEEENYNEPTLVYNFIYYKKVIDILCDAQYNDYTQ